MEQTGQLLGRTERLLEVKVIPLILDIVYDEPLFRTEYDRLVTVVRTALGEEAFAAALATGRALTLEQAMALALEGSSHNNHG